MNTFKLTIAYDGTRFCGWQQQEKQRSVLGEIEKTFTRVFKTDALMLGASRTDVGVHALGQVMRCKTTLAIEPHKLAWALNNSLPEDIHIRNATLVPITFHPWYNVAYKTYYYHIALKRPLPFIAPYVWHIYQDFDVVKFEAALQCYLGTHDFRSLCCADDIRENTTRTIDSISLEYIKRYGIYRVAVTGESFLRHMIRRMVGAAAAVAIHTNKQVNFISTVLEQKNPHQALPTAPGKGLLLRKVRYHE